ncbi:protachykinin-1 isoform X1 [Petaurus breviceps papuanus]|uniref:protachykinin-1 isoform X1 n=1 Tax=Petaurus breviceps papuanus TaxID=3040969 RepID=UPI0036D799D6
MPLPDCCSDATAVSCLCLSVLPSPTLTPPPHSPPQEELSEPFEHFLQRIARRPKPQQFFGLMGKRDAGHGQISHKRSSEWNTAQNYERRRK